MNDWGIDDGAAGYGVSGAVTVTATGPEQTVEVGGLCYRYVVTPSPSRSLSTSYCHPVQTFIPGYTALRPVPMNAIHLTIDREVPSGLAACAHHLDNCWPAHMAHNAH